MSDNTTPPAEARGLGPEWTPCRKRPVVVHVREQRPDEQHISTREGITPVQSDDLIMRGVEGEEYPIGRALFVKTYDLVTEAQVSGGGISSQAHLETLSDAARKFRDDGLGVFARLVELARDHFAALSAQPRPIRELSENERAAVEFYTHNPSAAVADLKNRITQPASAPVGADDSMVSRATVAYFDALPVSGGEAANREAMRAALQAALAQQARPDDGEAVAWLGTNPRTGAPETTTRKPAPSVMRDFNMRPLIYGDTTPPSAPVGVEEVLARLGLKDARRGSRAVGHSGPENNEWEDYVEVPESVLCALAQQTTAVDSGRESVGTVLGGEFHYIHPMHGLPDGTKLYTRPTPEDVARLVKASEDLGAWMAAALDDPEACAEFKADAAAFLAAFDPFIAAPQEGA